MLIVKVEDNMGFHASEFQSGRTKCWQRGYVEVPKNLESTFMASKGYCDLVIEGGVLTNIIPRPNCEPGTEENTSTREVDPKQLRADIDYIAIMTGVEL